ncbi:hypothetical protein, partial [Pseudoalteromonas distincta]|uniref:hypothetical protein n=1 Tax=Pseudoalteromonas distincta TaxID=77608 RepID=UPI0034E8C7A5
MANPDGRRIWEAKARSHRFVQMIAVNYVGSFVKAVQVVSDFDSSVDNFLRDAGLTVFEKQRTV